MNNFIVSTSVLLLISLVSCQSGQESVGGKGKKRKKTDPVSFFTLNSGQYSGATEAATLLVRSEAQFDSVWKVVFSNVEPKPERPAVNFENQAIVVYLAGMKSSGGYIAEIRSVATRKKQVYIDTHLTTPGPDCMSASVITSPFAFARIALEGDEPEVVLSHTETAVPCSN